MRETGQAAVPVAESGRLVGLLTSDNVGDLLLVRQALRRYMSNAAT
jgi:CBS domain-containing protein